MKKFSAVAAAALLCGALALAACGGKPNGEIAGNYREITAAELNEKLNTFSQNGPEGGSDEEKNLGFAIEERIEIEADTRTEENEKAPKLFACDLVLSGETQYVAASGGMDGGENKTGAKARSSHTLSGRIEKSEAAGIEKDIAADYKFTAFLKDGNLYLSVPDMDWLPLKLPEKGKYMLPADMLSECAFSILAAAAGTSLDAEEILNAYGLKAYADESSGLKLKISADSNAFYAAMADICGCTRSRAEQYVSFDEFEADLYLEADGDGAFVRAGLILDIDGSLSVTAGNKAVYGDIKIEADIAVKRFAGEVVTPTDEELKEYKSLLNAQTAKINFSDINV